MIVDPHTHTNVSSQCSRMAPEELVEAALELGLDAVAVTDHSGIAGAEVTREVGQRAGLTIFRGVEVYTGDGDMLVYGIYRDIEPCESALDLVRWVHAEGGVVVAAHPFRGAYGFGGLICGVTPDEVLAVVDAIETINGADPDQARAAAQGAADRFRKARFGGSDAHRPKDVGRSLSVFERWAADDAAFVEEIRAGRLKGMIPAAPPEPPRPRWWLI